MSDVLDIKHYRVKKAATDSAAELLRRGPIVKIGDVAHTYFMTKAILEGRGIDLMTELPIEAKRKAITESTKLVAAACRLLKLDRASAHELLNTSFDEVEAVED